MHNFNKIFPLLYVPSYLLIYLLFCLLECYVVCGLKLVKYVLSSPWDSEKRNFDLFVCLEHVKKLTIKLTLTLTLTNRAITNQAIFFRGHKS